MLRDSLNMATVLLVVGVLCEVVDVVWAQEMDCYGPGSIAGAVIGTFVATLIILGILFLAYKFYWKPRKGKHLVLETDPEQGDKYAFDNPCFKDAGLTPIAKALDKSGSRLLDTSGKKWSQWSPLGALVSTKNEKKRTVDDSCIPEGSEVKVVSLRSHDFTGLGFNICGNMRDGIYIKDVLHRGPASESGKLNPGDRINSVRISFEHMVYEDALTILSYASPYEVQVEAKGGFKGPGSGGQGAEPRHPLFRSASSNDLVKVGKSARQRLFKGENLDTSLATDYSTLTLSSNNTTLERGRKSPRSDVNTLTKPERTKKIQPAPVNKALTPEQLKSQLEHNLAQKISHPADRKHNRDLKTESEVQNSEVDSKKGFQKFGVRVLPMESNLLPARSPKSSELSQNDNNINLERHLENDKEHLPEGIDEVDKTKAEKTDDAPPVKRREKNKIADPVKESVQEVKVVDTFVRQNSVNGSGIKRDKAGIPQEIPEHMMQAAVAARNYRKSTEIIDKVGTETDENEAIKTPKKQKGKAPAPPPELSKLETKIELAEEPHKNVSTRLNFTDNFDEIKPIEEKDTKTTKPSDISNIKKPEHDEGIAEIKQENGVSEKVTDEAKEYCSDSDMETDNQSSVNTIELNSSDITIHHSEEDGTDMKGRKTASTGDLSKIQKGKKPNTGTLERAQSLDITDSGIPTLTKKRKATKDDLNQKLSSDESLYEQTALKNKEPRLSLALDGLDTFQRNRLKKSSEWGNLEDVVLNLDKVDPNTPTDSEEKIEFVEAKSPIKFDFGVKDTKFGNSVTQINDIHVISTENNDVTVSVNKANEVIEEVKVKNVLWPLDTSHDESPELRIKHIEKTISKTVPKNEVNTDIEAQVQDFSNVKVHNVLWPVTDTNQNKAIQPESPIETIPTTISTQNKTSKTDITNENKTERAETQKIEPSFSLKAQFQEKLNSKLNQTNNEVTIDSAQSQNRTVTNLIYKNQSENPIYHPGKSSQNFIFAEKYASNNDSDGMYGLSSKYDTNASDDIKVSRHSLGSLERPKSDVLKSVNKLKMQNLISSDKGGVSNITVTENGVSKNTFEKNNQSNASYDMSTASELYTTAIDSTENENISITELPLTPTGIKNITIHDTKLLADSPSSLTIDTSSDGPDSIKSNTLTFVTEIQVTTPTNNGGTHGNVSEIEINSPSIEDKPEEFKKLPEMKFSTSSYESPKTPEKRMSQIELLRSNFEKSPPKPSKPEISPSKSRIPVLATSKVDVKSSPERKEFKIGEIDTEEREIVEIMSSAVHSTPLVVNQRFANTNIKNPTKNVTVTSIRTSSKIPSGHHGVTAINKPPVPARPIEHTDVLETRSVSSNGGTESTFKQWVFNPSESSVTNIVVNNKESHK